MAVEEKPLIYLWDKRAVKRYHRMNTNYYRNTRATACGLWCSDQSLEIGDVPKNLTPCPKCFPRKKEDILAKLVALPHYSGPGSVSLNAVLEIVRGEK